MSEIIRADGRSPGDLRPITIERGWSAQAEGSALISFGGTKVLCTASFTNGVPRWLTGKGRGWITAEYAMKMRPDHKTRLAFEIESKWMGLPTLTAWYFLVEKTPCNPSLLKIVNDTIKELRDSGEMAKIYAEVGLTDAKLWTPPAGWKEE